MGSKAELGLQGGRGLSVPPPRTEHCTVHAPRPRAHFPTKPKQLITSPEECSHVSTAVQNTCPVFPGPAQGLKCGDRKEK